MMSAIKRYSSEQRRGVRFSGGQRWWSWSVRTATVRYHID